MRMFKLIYLFVFSLLLFSCAQIGTITGGQKDVFAPKIVKIQPENYLLNFNDKQLKITFDEYFVLNKAEQNIIMVPPDAVINTLIDRKSLLLNWEESLRKNTTYSIYFNKAIKDVTEGNDSIMSIVFSTGSTIDSLSLTVMLKNAFTNAPVKNAVFGLYDSLSALRPRYFISSDVDGKATLSHISEGTYFLKAFEDVNNDLSVQAQELQGLLFNSIAFDADFSDTLIIRLSHPLFETRIKNVKFLPPGMVGMHVPENFNPEQLTFLDKTVKSDAYFYPKRDSLILFTGPMALDNGFLVYEQDSISIRFPEKDRKLNVSVKLKAPEQLLSNESPMVLEINDQVAAVDASKFNLLNAADSTSISIDSVRWQQQQIFIFADWKNSNKLSIQLKKDAVKGKSESYNNPTTFALKRQIVKDFGTLKVTLSDTITKGVLELVKGVEVLRSQIIDGKSNFVFTNLIPGEYYFRIILDENQNGIWDPIQPSTLRQAEHMLWFKTPIKLRANWEVESQLEINQP